MKVWCLMDSVWSVNNAFPKRIDAVVGSWDIVRAEELYWCVG